nr:hypothetical protein [Tanacetum cinerariifolium]
MIKLRDPGSQYTHRGALHRGADTCHSHKDKQQGHILERGRQVVGRARLGARMGVARVEMMRRARMMMPTRMRRRGISIWRDMDMERPWSPQEDHMLLNLAEKHGLENLSLISESLQGRSGLSCSSRWFSLERSFTPEEDEMLQNLLEKHGPNWSLISESMPGRSAKSCELRRSSFLQFVHRPFTPKEDETILRLHELHGNKWATIARLLGGRMDNVIKKRWNSTLKWKSSPMTDEDNITTGAQDRNLNQEVGGVSGRKPPSISDMGRDNVSSEGTHSYSRDRSTPSLNAINERDSSLFSDEDWKWMMTGSDNVQEFAGNEYLDCKNQVEGWEIYEAAPSRNALNERDSSVVTDDN